MARVADLLGDRLADPHWDLLVLVGAVLTGDILALLQRLVGAHLVRHLPALLAGHVLAHLLRHVPTHGVRHLLLLGLGHVLAGVVGVLFAGAGDGSPDLVVAVALPLVLAVLLVLGGALGLGVRLVLRLVLVHTHTLVHSVTALLVNRLALLSGGGLAQPLVHGVADLLVVGDALLGLLLLVLGVPDGGVLGPALDGAGVEPGWVRWSVHSIVWSSCGQADQEGGEDWSHLCVWSPVSVPC